MRHRPYYDYGLCNMVLFCKDHYYVPVFISTSTFTVRVNNNRSIQKKPLSIVHPFSTKFSVFFDYDAPDSRFCQYFQEFNSSLPDSCFTVPCTHPVIIVSTQVIQIIVPTMDPDTKHAQSRSRLMHNGSTSSDTLMSLLFTCLGETFLSSHTTMQTSAQWLLVCRISRKCPLAMFVCSSLCDPLFQRHTSIKGF